MTPNNKKMAKEPVVKVLKHKRRFCREPGCTRIVKSQGLCQRHGAKPKKCKVDGCSKQAQGSFNGMCKLHFKTQHCVECAPAPKAPKQPTKKRGSTRAKARSPSLAKGESVYDRILPATIRWMPTSRGASNPIPAPLPEYLKEGFILNKEPAWHRNEERVARGFAPVEDPATPFEDWEHDLLWTEILVLTGSNTDSCFDYLAQGWGRESGFHADFANGALKTHCKDLLREPTNTSSMASEDQNNDCSESSYANVWDDDEFFGDDDALDDDVANFHSAEVTQVTSMNDKHCPTPSIRKSHIKRQSVEIVEQIFFNIEALTRAENLQKENHMQRNKMSRRTFSVDTQFSFDFTAIAMEFDGEKALDFIASSNEPLHTVVECKQSTVAV